MSDHRTKWWQGENKETESIKWSCFKTIISLIIGKRINNACTLLGTFLLILLWALLSTRHFHPQSSMLLFFSSFYVNFCVWKCQGIRRFLNTQTSTSFMNTSLMSDVKIKWNSWCVSAWCYCHMIGWLDYCINVQIFD